MFWLSLIAFVQNSWKAGKRGWLAAFLFSLWLRHKFGL